jgi:hypothetical protein
MHQLEIIAYLLSPTLLCRSISKRWPPSSFQPYLSLFRSPWRSADVSDAERYSNKQVASTVRGCRKFVQGRIQQSGDIAASSLGGGYRGHRLRTVARCRRSTWAFKRACGSSCARAVDRVSEALCSASSTRATHATAVVWSTWLSFTNSSLLRLGVGKSASMGFPCWGQN